LSWWRVAVSMDGCADPDSLGDVIASNICDVDTIDGLAIFVVFPEDTISLGSDTLLTWKKLFEDLADTVRYNDTTHQWVGIPETTYTAKMPDGTIPYTITLRAGQGKLIKIAQSSKKQ
jgi:hypothetical protein